LAWKGREAKEGNITQGWVRAAMGVALDGMHYLYLYSVLPYNREGRHGMYLYKYL
jgi:hypothetical protein